MIEQTVDKQYVSDLFNNCYAELANYVPPPSLFSLDIPKTKEEVMVIPRGGIGIIGGTEGSRKTTLLKSFVLAYFNDQFGFIKTDVKDKKGVLWIDTELGKSTFLRHQKEITEFLIKRDREHLYKFGSFMNLGSADMKRKAFSRVIELYEEGSLFDEIEFIVLDGIADLTSNVNDEADAKEMIDFVVGACSSVGVGLLSAMHLTKITKTVRGNLGAIGKQKADTVFNLTLLPENNKTFVSFEKVRHGPFKSFFMDGNSIDTLDFKI